MFKGIRRDYRYIIKSLPLEKYFITWLRKDAKIKKLNTCITRCVIAHSASHAVWLLRKMGYDVTKDYLACKTEPI